MDDVFLDGCEAEALHHVTAILPHGTLIAASTTGTIDYLAANTTAFLPTELDVGLGRPLPDLLASFVQDLPSNPGARLVFGRALLGQLGNLDLVVTRGAEHHTLFEFTPTLDSAAQGARGSAAAPAPIRGQANARPHEAQSEDSAEQRLVEFVAEQTQFQRVMYYRFRDRGDGEVIAEARDPDVYGSYLGLRFPASDIPRIARLLYIKNPWRMIPNVTDAAVPVQSSEPVPLDLTWSGLRAVSHLHQIYLANMGVAASLSFPVVVNGSLAALIAAHHREARLVGPELMDRISLRVRAHAFKVTETQTSRRIRLLDGINRHFADFRAILHRHGSILSAWPELGAWLVKEFQVHGAMVCMDHACAQWGEAFAPAALDAMDAWFCQESKQMLWSGDSLARALPSFPLSAIAGCLALRVHIPGSRNTRIYLTRIECIHDVDWGGSPEKPIEYHDGKLGIAPRRSFEKWVERRVGYSQPWDNESQLLALKLRELLIQELA